MVTTFTRTLTTNAIWQSMNDDLPIGSRDDVRIPVHRRSIRSDRHIIVHRPSMIVVQVVGE